QGSRRCARGGGARARPRSVVGRREGALAAARFAISHVKINGILARQIQDESFHEIQLNGKQLVFLFMAATVISVVIFLLGVLVGRGARAELTATVASADVPSPELTAAPPAATPTPAPAGSDPTAAAPPPAVHDLS